MIDFGRAAFRVSIRRAYRVVPVCRTTYPYRSWRPEQAPLRKRICEISVTRMRYGYRRFTVLLRREGWHVNVKRVGRRVSAEVFAIVLKASHDIGQWWIIEPACVSPSKSAARLWGVSSGSYREK